MHHEQLSSDLKSSIRACHESDDVCRQTLAHCLTMGGEHVEADHVRSLLDCAEICQTSANFMSRGSDRHGEICGVCADVCRECAESCRSVGGVKLDRCAEVCETTAAACDRMATGGGTRQKHDLSPEHPSTFA